MSNSKQSHLAAAKRILRYLKGTLNYGILFPHQKEKSELYLWILSLISELNLKTDDFMELQVDNKSAIDLARNPVSHGRSKHIETKFHFLRDQVNKGKIRLKHCGVDLQLADIMTKALKADRFKLLRNMLGVVHI